MQSGYFTFRHIRYWNVSTLLCPLSTKSPYINKRTETEKWFQCEISRWCKSYTFACSFHLLLLVVFFLSIVSCHVHSLPIDSPWKHSSSQVARRQSLSSAADQKIVRECRHKSVCSQYFANLWASQSTLYLFHEDIGYRRQISYRYWRPDRLHVCLFH